MRKVENILWALKVRWHKRKQARQEHAAAKSQFESDGSIAVAHERADAFVLEQLLEPNEFKGILRPSIEWQQLWCDFRPGMMMAAKITTSGLGFIGLLWLISKL